MSEQNEAVRVISSVVEVERGWVVRCWCGAHGGDVAWTTPQHAAAQANRFDRSWPECVHLRRRRERAKWSAGEPKENT